MIIKLNAFKMYHNFNGFDYLLLDICSTKIILERAVKWNKFNIYDKLFEKKYQV